MTQTQPRTPAPATGAGPAAGQAPPARFAPARDASRSARAGVLGIVLAVLVVALGVACVREALVADGRIDGTPWLAPTVDRIDGLAPSVAVAAIGAAVALLGLWLVLQAFGRRRRTRLAVSTAGPGAPSGVTIGVVDAARLARVAALEVDDVLAARAMATRRTVTVTVTVPPGAQVVGQVQAAVARQLSPLSAPPSVKVVSRVSDELRSEGTGS
ncbi:hypothetical protein OMK64_16455 [Cellulomonas fimi]|uniref:hypothetical protein n=1 Tax=Cellulomonas fimi TaxID=1708 RepID=UPI00234D0A08|nr:hypothetical protein [Cellulomonas fimi]MDC7123124.1 hypothetical protein [Cellulomonas fimi]